MLDLQRRPIRWKLLYISQFIIDRVVNCYQAFGLKLQQDIRYEACGGLLTNTVSRMNLLDGLYAEAINGQMIKSCAELGKQNQILRGAISQAQHASTQPLSWVSDKIHRKRYRRGFLSRWQADE